MDGSLRREGAERDEARFQNNTTLDEPGAPIHSGSTDNKDVLPGLHLLHYPGAVYLGVLGRNIPLDLETQLSKVGFHCQRCLEQRPGGADPSRLGGRERHLGDQLELRLELEV